MNDLIYNKIKIEYETTDIELDALINKYNLDKKKLKGCNSWTKNLLEPVTKSEKRKHLTTHSNIVADNIDSIEVDDSILVIDDRDSDKQFAKTVLNIDSDEVQTNIIHEASQALLNGSAAKLPKKLKDGYEGLRLLDTNLQIQANKLLTLIDNGISNVDETDTKSIKELVTAHTALRDTYFNSKNTMVNIINGDVTNNTQNNLATVLQEVTDDC